MVIEIKICKLELLNRKENMKYLLYRLLPLFVLERLAERKYQRETLIDTTYDSVIDESYFTVGRKG